MENILSKVASLLTYQGPNISELLSKAIEDGQDYKIIIENQWKILSITTVLPYNTKTQDNYYYNPDGDLIKQTIIINGKEKLVFDKFKEAERMLHELESREVLVS